MTWLADILIAFLLVAGGFFGLVGAWGLVRLPDMMTRLHGPTKAATLGVGSVLIASIAYFWVHHGHLGWHELLIALFVFMTSPITGLFVGKAHMHLSWKRDELPRPPSGADWATYGRGAETSPIVQAPDQPRASE
ncbi:Na+/H+ antiporter subunit G [Paracoccus sp. (in: a-proteobacteria)]|uniref:Na+/H+ antiporter subunit G n=1 Tax=Paracoccus sp. TaxID=267 RepID=UPI0026E0A818|nr:Na+/H+ antiporter subunit G [Paracoccus sp. (in: a-proteobacteria)]MDO5370754.1 Na+/H+ antiporter subunit G [Paracoccus sp. (in: a-proteobacteria)]